MSSTNENRPAIALNRFATFVATQLAAVSGMDPLDSRVPDTLEQVHLEAARMQVIAFPVEAVEISEAQVVAFLAAKAREVKAKFGGDQYAVAGYEVALYGIDEKYPPTIKAVIGSGALTKHYYAETFAKCLEASGAESPEKRAQEKREIAAKLLAEAEALAPSAK